MFKSLKNQLAFFSLGAVLVTAAIFVVIDYIDQQRTNQLVYAERSHAQSHEVERTAINSIVRLQENLFQATRNQAFIAAVLAQNTAVSVHTH